MTGSRELRDLVATLESDPAPTHPLRWVAWSLPLLGPLALMPLGAAPDFYGSLLFASFPACALALDATTVHRPSLRLGRDGLEVGPRWRPVSAFLSRSDAGIVIRVESRRKLLRLGPDATDRAWRLASECGLVSAATDPIGEGDALAWTLETPTTTRPTWGRAAFLPIVPWFVAAALSMFVVNQAWPAAHVTPAELEWLAALLMSIFAVPLSLILLACLSLARSTWANVVRSRCRVTLRAQRLTVTRLNGETAVPGSERSLLLHEDTGFTTRVRGGCEELVVSNRDEEVVIPGATPDLAAVRKVLVARAVRSGDARELPASLKALQQT